MSWKLLIVKNTPASVASCRIARRIARRDVTELLDPVLTSRP
jgi:hypothetical protein